MDNQAMAITFNVVTTIIPLILAIAVHEWAHVAMARFLGDRTGEEQGRLTLNPLAHIDPLWTVALPVFSVISQTVAGSSYAVPFFAAGKPAPYTPIRLDRRFGGKRITMRTAELLVAAAGPMSNVALAVISFGILVGLTVAGVPLAERSIAVLVLQFLLMNVGLALFNLLPVPPLDGSKVLASLLPRSAAARYEDLATKASYVLFLLLIMGGARVIIGPVKSAVLLGVLAALDSLQ